MATVPVQIDEESLVREKIRALELPEGVKFKRLELGSEWTGEPAWRIHFSVSQKIPLTRPRVAALNRLRDALEEEIFSLRPGKWPFVHFEDAR